MQQGPCTERARRLFSADRCVDFGDRGQAHTGKTVSFQILLNCLDGVSSQDGVLVVASANDAVCLDPAILEAPGRFDRGVQFRNPDANLRRQYYRRLSQTLAGEKFEIAIEKTDGFSFAQLRETLYSGVSVGIRAGREVGAADVVLCAA
jgi:ATP-dependent 26S proteasome regulatory subunit